MTRHEDAEPHATGMATVRATGGLLAGLNRDIRTSMNGVAGMLALLLDAGLTPAQQELAANALHCAEDLMTLIESVVDLSMIEAGRFELRQASFDLPSVLQSACAAPSAAARDKGIELRVDYPAALRLLGDAARLRQVIGTLVNSAVSLARHGEITVDLQAAHSDTGRRHVRMTVNVPAFDAAGQQLIALLNQPDKPDMTALPTQGRIALELALCKQLARLMNAQIEADNLSPEAVCIRFGVTLPDAPAALAGKRVLLTEQDVAARDDLAQQLRAEGMQVDAFNTVTDALAALGKANAENDSYRIAVLGRNIQGMDFEVLGAAIKSEMPCRDIRLVALSDCRYDNAGRLARAGFSAMIDMPVQQETVLTVFSALCDAIDSGSPLPFIHAGAMPAPLGGRRILVADDNPVNLQVAQRLLEKFGCRADSAADGEQAIAMHAAHPYDLILMDCQMPHLDGYQATQRIRQLDGDARHTPIVALTACAMQGERENCLSQGMNDFIPKPVRPQTLQEVLERWLAQASPEQVADAIGCDDELEVVRDMFGADFSELSNLYRNDSPPRIAALRQAGAAGDFPQVAKVAHAFSGSSVSIGATGLSALCKDLETRAKTNSLDDFVQRMAAIETEYNRISGKLQTMCRSNFETT